MMFHLFVLALAAILGAVFLFRLIEAVRADDDDWDPY